MKIDYGVEVVKIDGKKYVDLQDHLDVVHKLENMNKKLESQLSDDGWKEDIFREQFIDSIDR